jgi:hypothetical protein
MCRWPLVSQTFYILFIVGSTLTSCVPPGHAQAGYPPNAQDSFFDNYVWFKALLSDREIASSRGDAVLNYLEVGDLSASSYYLVDQTFKLLADISKMKVLKSDEFCSAFLRCCGCGECRQSIAR